MAASMAVVDIRLDAPIIQHTYTSQPTLLFPLFHTSLWFTHAKHNCMSIVEVSPKKAHMLELVTCMNCAQTRNQPNTMAGLVALSIPVLARC